MKQTFEAVNDVTPEGFADGGHVYGLGIAINWQRGPLRHERGTRENGCFVETAIEAVKQRLEFYQSGPHACAENAQAINALAMALEVLESRTKRREDAGVEGTHDVDAKAEGPDYPRTENPSGKSK